jgi:riboflavin synthase
MFTGIVQDIGHVAAIAKNGDWRLTIKTALPLANTGIGASICVSGACLTVIGKTGDTFDVQVSPETLDKTTIKYWQTGTRINLEPALRMGDELGGHLVTGHVDGVAGVIARRPSEGSIPMMFDAPQDLARFIAPKGAVVIDGVSLTVNLVEQTRFSVTLIPHTKDATTLGALAEGDAVNIEVDMIARYLDRLIQK